MTSGVQLFDLSPFLHRTFLSTRLMSLMLIQLIRYAGNLADLRGLSRSSCRADVAKQGDNEDDNSINRFKEFGELNVIIVDTTVRTDSVGETGTLFLADAR